MQVNEQIFQFLYGLANKSIPLDILIVFFAQYSLYILVIATATLIILEPDFRRRSYFFFLTILSVMLSSGIVVPLGRFFYPSPRPFIALNEINPLIFPPDSSSMPSGHMMFIVPIAISMFYLNRKVGLWFIATTVLIGISRVAAGVHWPLDILAGMLLGALCFYTVKLLLDARYKVVSV